MKQKLSQVIGIMLSLFMLMQMTTAFFAATSELTWALAPTANTLVNLYGDRDVYTYGMGLCFQAADSGQYGVMDKSGTVIIPAEYEKVVSFYGDAYVQVVKDGKHRAGSFIISGICNNRILMQKEGCGTDHEPVPQPFL